MSVASARRFNLGFASNRRRRGERERVNLLQRNPKKRNRTRFDSQGLSARRSANTIETDARELARALGNVIRWYRAPARNGGPNPLVGARGNAAQLLCTPAARYNADPFQSGNSRDTLSSQRDCRPYDSQFRSQSA